MLRYRPRFRQPAKAAAPPNLPEAESMPPGATPLYGDPVELMREVETPAGKTKAPAVLKTVAQAHDGMAGIYGAVLAEGMICKGDPVELLR